jgi:hypothetical protein
MLPDDIYEYTRAIPFRPFRITLTSGEEFDVHHPDMVMATFSKVMIARHVPSAPENRRIAVSHVNSQQILEIEDLTSAAKPPLEKSTV